MRLEREPLIALVEAFDAAGDGEALKSRELILHLLRHTGAPFSRAQFAPGHITATALVFDPRRERILLVHHKRLGRWLLPGGHVEAQDGTIFEAAAREAREETAVVLEEECAPRVASMDVHGIPPNTREPYHLHHDLIVGFQARNEALAVSEESNAVIWCGLEDLRRRDVAPSIVRAAQRAREG